MIERLTERLTWPKRLEDERGQALIEAAFCLPVLFMLAFGLVDFAQMISDNNVMSGISRQGSDLASRGTSLTATMSALDIQGASLNIGTQGMIIVTEVANSGPGLNNFRIVDQVQSPTGISVTSSVGSVINGPATMPPGATTVLNAGQTLYVTEVFYSYKSLTPIGGFLKISLASTLYQVAYF